MKAEVYSLIINGSGNLNSLICAQNSLFGFTGNLRKKRGSGVGFSAILRLGLAPNRDNSLYFPVDQGIFP
jgi:hypothetical protein